MNRLRLSPSRSPNLPSLPNIRKANKANSIWMGLGRRRNCRKAVSSPFSPCSGRRLKEQNVDLLLKTLLRNPITDETEDSNNINVSFNESENKIIPPENKFLTQEEIEDAWWTHDDFHFFACDYRACLKEHRNLRQPEISRLMHIVNLCKQSSSDNDINEMEMAVSQFPTGLRGMEADVVPILKYMRKRHSKTVLGFMDGVPKHFHLDLKERMIAARSMQMSRPFKTFARVAAKADSRDASKQGKKNASILLMRHCL